MLSSTNILVEEISGAEKKMMKRLKNMYNICKNSNYIAYFGHITRLLAFYSYNNYCWETKRMFATSPSKILKADDDKITIFLI